MKQIILIFLLVFSGFSITISAEKNESLETISLLSQNNNRKQTSSSVDFYSPDSVMAWLSGKTFISDDTSIRFSYDAVYLNGTAVTGAPIVKRFTQTTATIEAHSPYMGGASMTFYLVASQGIVTQARDTFYLKSSDERKNR